MPHLRLSPVGAPMQTSVPVCLTSCGVNRLCVPVAPWCPIRQRSLPRARPLMALGMAHRSNNAAVFAFQAVLYRPEARLPA